METDYDTRRKSRGRKWLIMGSFGGWTAGILITLGGFMYPNLNTPQPTVLERYEEIKKELRIPGQTAHANKLEIELYEIESNPNFALAKKSYEQEHQINKDTGYYISSGGAGLALLSLMSAFLLKKKTRKRRNIRTFTF